MNGKRSILIASFLDWKEAWEPAGKAELEEKKTKKTRQSLTIL